MPAGYDNWKLATPWDDEKPSDEVDVTVKFRLTEADGTVYSATFTRSMRRDDADDMDGDFEATVIEFENELDTVWVVADGDLLELV